jgi:hypothetical protein
MGRQLYRALPLSHCSVLDEAQARGIFNFRQDDQLKAVEEIVKLFATDPPMAIVTRLISTFNKSRTVLTQAQGVTQSFRDSLLGPRC